LVPTMVAKQVFAGVAASTLIQALPGVGLASRILSGGALVAEVVQTVLEVLGSPALFTNTLSLVMDTTVVIEHDPADFRFPARAPLAPPPPAAARHYEITLIYDEASKLAHKHPGDVEPGRVDPIEWVFEKVPSGGKVTVDVVLTTEEGYIIGRSVDASGHEGPIGPIDNTPENAGTITVQIKERLIPLTEGTRYLHDLELKVEDGRRVWAQGPAPTATRAALCLGQDDRLRRPRGIPLHH